MHSVYVHIPYCHSKCAYCDFYSSPRAGTAPRLVAAIAKEYELRRNEADGPVSTVYIGGGTPSVLPDSLLAELVDALPRPEGEFTIEVNPEDVTMERVRAWRSMGVNRVSMGVQSLADSELAAIGRRHSAARAMRAAADIREAGITNISLDLICGLPGQTRESWMQSLAAALAFRPEHLSAYILSYEPGTRLTAMLRAGKIRRTDDAVIEGMYSDLRGMAREAGYEHYEISNFALPGFRARHNSGYWAGVPYIGLGPAAHSFDGATRRINPSSTTDYLSALENSSVAFAVDEETDDNRFNDLLVTRLRTAEGLDLSDVPPSRMAALRSDAAPLVSSGLLAVSGSRMWIPEEHWLVSDSVISSLMQV